MAAARTDNQYQSQKIPALGLRLLLFAGLSILMLIIDYRGNHLATVRTTIGVTIYPLRVIIDAPVSMWNQLRDHSANRNKLRIENNRLKAEILLTHTRMQGYLALEAENIRLRTMLEARTRVKNKVGVAGIMSVSANPFRHALVIDKGQNEGVYDGQTMINSDGVVGQVIVAGLFSAQAILISDPDHALPVEINRNGLRTIAVGTGELDRLDLPLLPNNADIRVGDLLVTSGLGGAFPAGYPVATIGAITRIPQEPFASVSAKPIAKLGQIREIMLIWSISDEDDAETEE
jgi:rod shape-determining protein MreC